jgi:hypothetical protein
LSVSAAVSQSNKKLVVMITRANWCPTCRANEWKLNKELIPAYSNSKTVDIVLNDVTNRRSKTKSKPELQAAGVYGIAQKELATGTILLINPVDGKILNRIYVAYPLADIEQAIDDALRKI